MSHKRKREEVTDAGHDRSEPSKQTTLKPGKTSFKPRGRGAYTSNAEPKTNATNALKNRIRSLRRLLEHVDNVPKHKMPANVRIERDRELEACEHELAEKTAAGREAELRNKMIGKYHQVRFFDRQKATRTLKRLKRELSTLEDQSKKHEIRQRIHNAEVDVNYAMYYPLMKPYSSLYPRLKREEGVTEEPADGEQSSLKREGQVEGPKGDTDMWKTVERAMKEGTLDALRNSSTTTVSERAKDDDRSAEKKQQKQNEKKTPRFNSTPKALKDSTIPVRQYDDNDSDGGFFE